MTNGMRNIFGCEGYMEGYKEVCDKYICCHFSHSYLGICYIFTHNINIVDNIYFVCKIVLNIRANVLL